MEGYKPFLQEVLRLHELTKRGSFLCIFSVAPYHQSSSKHQLNFLKCKIEISGQWEFEKTFHQSENSGMRSRNEQISNCSLSIFVDLSKRNQKEARNTSSQM